MATATATPAESTTTSTTPADTPATSTTAADITAILVRIEQRLAAIEAAITEIRAHQPAQKNWLDQLSGCMADEPAFEEAMALGRAAREADIPGPDDPL